MDLVFSKSLQSNISQDLTPHGIPVFFAIPTACDANHQTALAMQDK